MLNKLRKQTAGFTIIEVLIVLAIAGLILLIVFLAVPALQRNSRNTSRKNDVASILGAITEYTNNNSGQLPTDHLGASNMLANAKLGFYKSGTATATTPLTTAIPLGDVNVMASNTAITTGTPPVPPAASTVYIRLGGKCNAAGNDVGGSGASSRSTAAVYSVDTSSGTQSVCQDN